MHTEDAHLFHSTCSYCNHQLVVLFCSGVKMVNQLLAGVHIASADEAMAFGARLGLDTRVLFDVIKASEGTSWYGHVSWFIICSLLNMSSL